MALKGMEKIPITMTDDKKIEIDEKALTTIQLYPLDEVLRLVANETNTVRL